MPMRKSLGKFVTELGRLGRGNEPSDLDLTPAAVEAEGEPVKSAQSGAQKFFSSTNPPKPEQAAALACQMPALAGQPLEPPRFHKMNWRVGQKLYADRDDPDRAREPWQHPKFIERKNPLQQRSLTSMEELQIPRAAPGHRFARVVRNALSQED